MTFEHIRIDRGESIDWIVLNVERALGLRPVSTGESSLGSRLVPDLLTRLPYQLDVAERIHELVT